MTYFFLFVFVCLLACFLIQPRVPPRSTLIIVDVQNDFVSGTLALKNCSARQNGEDVVPVINALRGIGFDLITLTQDWHPASHLSFIENAASLDLAPTSAPPQVSFLFKRKTMAGSFSQSCAAAAVRFRFLL